MRAVYRLLFHLERDGVKVAPLNVVPIGTTEHLRDIDQVLNTIESDVTDMLKEQEEAKEKSKN